ncbi:MAG: hypothetical protein HYY37_04205 [Candidatus Aenigmarchaeota archaeon]|nr:hypothetical protein [Candidatus Aenigmarchaeota archaeon]
MADIDFVALLGVPLTPAGIVALLAQALVTALAILISDRLIAHNFEVKHAVMMSFAAYFVTPLAFAGIALSGFEVPALVARYVVPLLVWIALGEILLQSGDMVTKLKVAGVGFAVYIIMLQVGVAQLISSALPI